MRPLYHVIFKRFDLIPYHSLTQFYTTPFRVTQSKFYSRTHSTKLGKGKISQIPIIPLLIATMAEFGIQWI